MTLWYSYILAEDSELIKIIINNREITITIQRHKTKQQQKSRSFTSFYHSPSDGAKKKLKKKSHKQLDYHQDYPIVKSPLFVCRTPLINDSNHPHSQDCQLSASRKNIRRAVRSHTLTFLLLLLHTEEKHRTIAKKKKQNEVFCVHRGNIYLNFSKCIRTIRVVFPLWLGG